MLIERRDLFVCELTWQTLSCRQARYIHKSWRRLAPTQQRAKGLADAYGAHTIDVHLALEWLERLAELDFASGKDARVVDHSEQFFG